jgi:hypothetical protein
LERNFDGRYDVENIPGDSVAVDVGAAVEADWAFGTGKR